MNKRKKEPSLDKYLGKIIEQLEEKGKVEKTPDKYLIENRHLYSLLKITRSINTPRDFNQLLDLIVDSAITLTKAERGFLMLFNKDGYLEFRVTRNIDRKTLEGEKFEISRTVVNQVLASGKPLFLSDIYKDRTFKITESIEALGLRMVMCIPLAAKKQPLGVIYVDSHSETEQFTRLEEKMFEAFAAQASVTIENSHLYDASVHDALTGLYNYGYLRKRLEEEIVRAHGLEKAHISFILLDVDNFKMINDSHGHIFGNSVLVKVAELIEEMVRKYDIPARYGGDEFAILMPETNAQEAKECAQSLQKAIAALKYSIAKDTVMITASVGVSTFPVEKIVKGESIIVEADHALFIAKSKGGNQIAVCSLRMSDKKYATKLIGSSQAISKVIETTAKFAQTDATVLIVGETGTGKELIAKLLHQQSGRSNKPLVVVNCGAIPHNLLESELFGHEKGSFTGAYKQHKGKFDIAQGGTIFLDEIGELPLNLQVKLLRAIEQKEIDRIGGKVPIKTDVRIIAASNRNLEHEIKQGTFRKDLFYRLSVATIYVPPLRERPEDIEILSNYYLDHMNNRYKHKFIGFTKSAMRAMLHHPWYGNVRELIHRIERAVIMATGYYLNESDLNLVVPLSTAPRKLRALKELLERESVTQALIRNDWNITHTSNELGITPKTVRHLIKKYTITRSH
jgi:diguanylate cyclase (GGDEF)-like protein